jgi:Peptidase family M28/PA domain
MKKILLTLNFCACVLAVVAQQNNAATYAADITGATLKKHLTIIAGDEMEGRETGTEGQRKAAAYIETQFKQMGLGVPKGMDGYQQFYPLYQDSMTNSLVKLGEKELTYGTDYYIPVLNNRTRKAKAEKIIFAGYGISEKEYDDYKGLNVRGKVVVFFVGEPKVNGKYLVGGTEKISKYSYPGITEKVQVAEEKGAVAAIVINQSMSMLNSRTVQMNTRSNVYFPGKVTDKSIGYVTLSLDAAKAGFPEWNLDSVVKLAKTNAALNAAALPETKQRFSFDYAKERKEVLASNVLGIVEGSDKKDEYVFLTAHYDHLGKRDGKIYYGADDDGSGTCAVINMAEAFARAKAAGHGPRRTVVFMTVSGEEKGLWGSEYYSDHPVYPLANASVDLNTDMIGRIDTERKAADTNNYIYVVGHNKISSDLPKINEQVNQQFTGLVLDYKFDDPDDPERIYYRSDHYNFARKGVPVLFFYDGMLKADYHKPTDTVDKINWDLFEKRARMIFHTAWEMANRNQMLQRDIPLTNDVR